MKFKDLIDAYLRDYINEGITLDIISLIKTILQCKDVKNVTIDNHVYSNNRYAMNIYNGRIKSGAQKYVIWYVYKNNNYDIQIFSIYEDNYNECLAGNNDSDIAGVEHKFKELELEYIMV